MSLNKQSDVKNHLSARYRTEIHLQPPVSKADATGHSSTALDAENAKPSEFVKDNSMEHANLDKPMTPTVKSAGPIDPQASATSRSSQK